MDAQCYTIQEALTCEPLTYESDNGDWEYYNPEVVDVLRAEINRLTQELLDAKQPMPIKCTCSDTWNNEPACTCGSGVHCWLHCPMQGSKDIMKGE
jgi:hypothetical protein